MIRLLMSLGLYEIAHLNFDKKDIRSEGDSVVVGTVRNVHNLLSYGVVGKSVCRMWESCTLAFPCSVNGLFHDGIASYTHFHGACLLVFGSE